jgi:hypothetical protein
MIDAAAMRHQEAYLYLKADDTKRRLEALSANSAVIGYTMKHEVIEHVGN